MSTESTRDEGHSPEISEMNMDFIKVELKTEDQDEEDASMTEEVITERCPASSLHSQVPKVILMRQSSHDWAIVSNLYSLLEDFRTMAGSNRSLLCCQPSGHPSLLMCLLCGNYFKGANRLLKLFDHYQSVHPSDALQLILDATGRYKRLIGHMRKALEFDEWFGEINYGRDKRTKSFACSKCKIK